MALQTSGAISLNDIHVEAGGTSGTQASINDSDIRGLISKGSGVQMSFNEWYGASASTTYTMSLQTGSSQFIKSTVYGVVLPNSGSIYSQKGTMNNGTSHVTLGGITFKAITTVSVSTGGVSLSLNTSVIGVNDFQSITYPTASHLPDVTVPSSAFAGNISNGFMFAQVSYGNLISSGTFSVTI